MIDEEQAVFIIVVTLVDDQYRGLLLLHQLEGFADRGLAVDQSEISLHDVPDTDAFTMDGHTKSSPNLSLKLPVNHTADREPIPSGSARSGLLRDEHRQSAPPSIHVTNA